MKNLILILIILSITNISFSQDINGTVSTVSQINNEATEFLPGVNVYWAETTIGTVTNESGEFSLSKNAKKNTLVASFVGYINDSITVEEDNKTIKFVLRPNTEIREVIVEKDRDAQYYSWESTINKENISISGLEKLPCCNLSESFENNVAVDVSYTDAVSGAKQIQMLGLAGAYTQILNENTPALRGLASSYGLGFIPGPWMQSIQISKGTSSVINGYESLAGQINVELKKPEDGELFYLNLFANHMGKSEINLNTRFKVKDKLHTMFLLHGAVLPFTYDTDNDGFANMPLTNKINFVNRWKYGSPKTFAAQFGVKMLLEDRAGGQMDYLSNNKDTTGNRYGIGINIQRYEAFLKFGFPIKALKHASVGTMFTGTYHEQNSFFGRNKYNAIEKSFYANIIFQSIIVNTNHKINAGASFMYDDYDEIYNTENFLKSEIVPGVFTQYTYKYHDKFSAILGFRADFNNMYGLLLTPRVHFKYNLNENTTIRGSAGKGYRSANIFAENIGFLASSRNLIIQEELQIEEGWNYGINFTKRINIWDGKLLTFNIDFYRTDFVNQIIADIDANVSEIRFYNLNGKSYSNSFQTDLMVELFDGFDITTGYRFNDVKLTMHDDFINKPLVARHKGLLTLSFATKYDKWIFDITNQFTGPSHLPNTSQNPVEYQLSSMSPSYYILHVQITRNFRLTEFYIGSENVTNYTQKNPIIAADDPFGNYFDTSIIWAPIVGRAIYVGFRLKIK